MSKKQKIDPDYFLALTLQRKFNQEYKKEKNEKTKLFEPQPSCSDNHITSPTRKKPSANKPPFVLPTRPPSSNKSASSVSHSAASSSTPAKFSSSQSTSLNDSQWEVIDPTPDVHGLFVAFGRRFFHDRLGSVEVKWSKRMTSCAGVCRFKGRRDRSGRGIGEVTISLSEPLLKLRPRSDLVNTLLHEMIHAYLFLFTENPNRADRDDHGQEFQQHMHRINKEAGTKISIYHSFHDEVKLYKQHWWQCNGPCKSRPPFFGLVKRATNRAPGKYDFWFASHQAECGGQFIKTKEPDNFKARPRKNKENFGGGGGQIGATGSAMSSGGSAANVRGFGKPSSTNAKHSPTPGQPKIVGFVDVNKSATPSNPMRTNSGTNPAVAKPGMGNRLGSSSAVGGYTLGTNAKSSGTNTLGGYKLGTNVNNSGNKLGTNASYGGNKLGINANSSGNKLGINANNSGTNNLGGHKLGTVSRDNGSDGFYKLGTPLNKNIRSPTGSLASPTSENRPNSRPTNPIGSKLLDKLKLDAKNSNKGSGSSRGNVGGGSRGGFMGGGTRMNKGSGTMVLNPTKAATSEPNETAERITKPINKTENRLNLDLFKPFMGQGQTLGGGTELPDRTQSRLLATSTSTSNIRDSNNKKVCLGNRSLHSSSPSTSHANTRSSSSSPRASGSNSKDHLKWDLRDEEMEDDYEYKKVNSSFTKDGAVTSLDDSFGELEKMMNDTDVEVFDSIPEEALSGTLATESGNATERTADVSLDDVFEISSEEDPDDETHCPVCGQAIRRAHMNEHLENCMELSQVFDNVAVDEDEDELDERHGDDALADNANGDAGARSETRGGGNGAPSGMVKCPICNADIREAMANEHIDECLAKNISEELR